MDIVHFIFDHWDNIAIEGITDYNGLPYHFKCQFSIEDDAWTDEYELTKLDEYIFKLASINYQYFLDWLQDVKIPHPVEYARFRESETLQQLTVRLNENLQAAEKHYQNQLLFDKYIEESEGKINVKGYFEGRIKDENLMVKWVVG